MAENDKLEINFKDLARSASQYVFSSTFPSLERMLKTVQNTGEDNKKQVENLNQSLDSINNKLNEVNVGLKKLNDVMTKSLGVLGKILKKQDDDSSGGGNVIPNAALGNIPKALGGALGAGAMFSIIERSNQTPPAPTQEGTNTAPAVQPAQSVSGTGSSGSGSTPPAQGSGSSAKAAPATPAPQATPVQNQGASGGKSLIIKASTITFEAGQIVFGGSSGAGPAPAQTSGRSTGAGDTPPGMTQASLGSSSTSPSGSGNAGAAVDAASKLSGASITGNYGDIVTYLRTGGVGLDPAKEAWCAAFVNSSLAQAGIRGSGSQVANSFQKWGTEVRPTEVKKGDVVILTRGKGPNQTGGHVGLATGNMSGGGVEIIAGNTSKAVKTYSVPITSDVMIRRSPEANKNKDDLPLDKDGAQVAKAQSGPAGAGGSGAVAAEGSASSTTRGQQTNKTQVATRETAPKSTTTSGAALNKESTSSEVSSITPPSRTSMNNVSMGGAQQESSVPNNPKITNANMAGNVEPEDAATRYETLFGMKPKVPTGNSARV